MNSVKFVFAVICVWLIVFSLSCKHNQEIAESLAVIDLIEGLDNMQEIRFSDFIDEITYVPLEPTLENVVGVNPKVRVTEKHIWVFTSEQCILFNRFTGKFIREIGSLGRGPGEYASTASLLLNEDGSICYLKGWENNLLKYSSDGRYLGYVNVPYSTDSFFPGDYGLLNDTLFVVHHINTTGSESGFLTVFSESGKVVKIVPNKYLYDYDRFIYSTGEVRFHVFNDALFYYDTYNDTVFSISRDTLLPHFVLFRGEARPPGESKWWSTAKKSESTFLYHPPVYLESKNYILGHVWGRTKMCYLIFDKKTEILKIADAKTGIVNDVDGFMGFEFNTINHNGEISCIIQPVEILAWIEKNPEKMKSASPEIQNLKTLSPEDNPVVVIARVKGR